MVAGVNQGRAFPASQLAWHRKDEPVADGLGTPQPALVREHHGNPSDTAGRKGFLGYQLASGADTQRRLMGAGVNTGRAFPASQLAWHRKGHQKAKPKAERRKASRHPSVLNKVLKEMDKVVNGAGVSTGRAFPAPRVGPVPQHTWHGKGPQGPKPKALRRKSSRKSVLNQVLEELDKVEHDLSHDTGEKVAMQKRGDQVVPIYDDGTWAMKSRGMPELPNPGEARQAGINGLLDKIPGWSTKKNNNTTDSATYKNRCLEAVAGVLGSILFGIVLFCVCWLCKRRILKRREAKAKAAGNAAQQ
ncbi:uncharacterized protein [Patagioenas fasciata]|uniref:uncharacterized protein n=1 Tax=Patagioenas fasciata TaxID=372321 RepID=UPI003A998BB4